MEYCLARLSSRIAISVFMFFPLKKPVTLNGTCYTMLPIGLAAHIQLLFSYEAVSADKRISVLFDCAPCPNVESSPAQTRPIIMSCIDPDMIFLPISPPSFFRVRHRRILYGGW